MNSEKGNASHRIIVAAGGSGGHIFPAIALADELGRSGKCPVCFVASKRNLDRNILGETDHDRFYLSVNPMPRSRNPLKALVFLFKLASDMVYSLYILAKVRPDSVVGFGGYSCGAVLLCAKMFGIPVLIHEQNFFPGRANILLSRIADTVAVSFDPTGIYLRCPPEKIVFTGNPLRSSIVPGDRQAAGERLGIDPGKPTLLVMGGSQGSSFLNRTASAAVAEIYRRKAGEFQVIHLTGKQDESRVRDFYSAEGVKAAVFSFLGNINDAYISCDIALSRSGAAAVFELAHHGKPMILVPYPDPKNNQRSNAAYFADRGGAIYREENSLTAEALADEVSAVLFNGRRMNAMSEAALALSVPDAAERLAKAVLELAGHSARKKKKITR
ncbi:MAG: undecaprenyldiphospho-muramoylpentapeptide beta-N-acetylglucosaminyltransferase [Candidatus Omnitrophica bacterium]|nr:undecaprenyldiphospho-muramoylpentapeptide beta-N-acetylglucosaminyltransferase [Candidatus Omnitrophota bacterium]